MALISLKKGLSVFSYYDNVECQIVKTALKLTVLE